MVHVQSVSRPWRADGCVERTDQEEAGGGSVFWADAHATVESWVADEEVGPRGDLLKLSCRSVSSGRSLALVVWLRRQQQKTSPRLCSGHPSCPTCRAVTGPTVHQHHQLT